MHWRFTPRIFEERDIAVILSEKRGWRWTFFLFQLRLYNFVFRNTISWLPLNKPSITKYFFSLLYTIKGVFRIFNNIENKNIKHGIEKSKKKFVVGSHLELI